MRKGIYSIGIIAILSIATFFAVISITEKTIYAVDYDLWVGEDRVTSEHTRGICSGGGTWSYSGDATSGTLTLNNANILPLRVLSPMRVMVRSVIPLPEKILYV